MLTLRAILRLTRLDSSILGALAIFLPTFKRTQQVGLSIGRALPLLFICMCTFIANDLEDMEKDKVIYPDRPLPSRHLSTIVAGALYFTFLGLGLFSTRYFIPQDTAFWYYGLFTISISYGYFVLCFPGIKGPYVALAASIPIVIIARSYADEPKLYAIAGCVFLFMLGREICGDILDRDGDPVSFLHRFAPKPLALVAFCIEALGMILLTTAVRKAGDAIVLLAMTLILGVSAIYWFRLKRYTRAMLLMKVQLFVGLCFLTY